LPSTSTAMRSVTTSSPVASIRMSLWKSSTRSAAAASAAAARQRRRASALRA
jgi:hypothetical protein